jgi:hypothetical protein
MDFSFNVNFYYKENFKVNEKERLKLENVYQRVNALEYAMESIYELLKEYIYNDLHILLKEEDEYMNDNSEQHMLSNNEEVKNN